MSAPGREWDAIVVGASFGGLAAAMELAGSGRVLLIDRQPVGAGQTSACATPLPVLERLAAVNAIEQIHRELVIHGPGLSITRVVPSYPFATFDYVTLCRTLFAQTDASYLQAAVLRRDDEEVVTTEGRFRAPLLIDASGWRSVLADTSTRQGRLGLGIEVSMSVQVEGLHLWLRPPELDRGLAWVFPAGARSRVGIARYDGKGELKNRLVAFAPSSAGLEIHGGALPASFGAATLPGVFRVGDAAGQCLPVTGEGIRPALVFGQLAGRLARRVLEDRSSLDGALRGYRGQVRRRAPYYAFLGALQDLLLAVPPRLAGTFTSLIAVCFQADRAYWWAANPRSLDSGSWATAQPKLAEPA